LKPLRKHPDLAVRHLTDEPSVTTGTLQSAASEALRPAQLAWLAAAVISVSAGYGALMPVLPGWLGSMMPDASPTEIARHVGLFSGVYAAGVLIGALLWGVLSNSVERSRILILGYDGNVRHAQRDDERKNTRAASSNDGQAYEVNEPGNAAAHANDDAAVQVSCCG
jgi:hypothetical protein